ncbi:hypothetical protein ACHAXN_006271 [Cyclotella atomus]
MKRTFRQHHQSITKPQLLRLLTAAFLTLTWISTQQNIIDSTIFSVPQKHKSTTPSCSGNHTPSNAVHFRTYGDDSYNWTKSRILQEALDTGWFASAQALGPSDLSSDFCRRFREILNLTRGGGYWIWKYNVIELALRDDECVKEGDFVLYLDAGSGVNKGGEGRFREYLQMINESRYDMLCFQLPTAESKFTTERIFRAFNVSESSKAGERDYEVRNSGQMEGGTLLMQKGPHLRGWLQIVMDALKMDPWIITDIYNEEARAFNPHFRENRHDQSLSSVSRKLHGCEVVSGRESKDAQPDKPFHVLRLKEPPR